MNTAVKKPPPRRKDEIAINARLLYLYVGQPRISYENWAASLHPMVASPGNVQRYQLMTGEDGELALNAYFATHFAHQVASDLMGAIALILIDEGCHAAGRGDFDYTNRMLGRFRALAMVRGQMHSETLHSFLEIDQTWERWIAGLKKKYGMKYRRDYIRITFNGHADPKVHPKDTGKGEVIFGPRFAMKVANDEPTRRGKLVRKWMMSAGISTAQSFPNA